MNYSHPSSVVKFLDYLKLHRRASDHTVHCYSTDLEQFLNWLDGKIGRDHVIPGFTTEQRLLGTTLENLKAFVAYLISQNYKASSIARKAATVRSFFRWATKTGVVGQNPALELETPDVPRVAPRTISNDQIMKLINGIEGTDFIARRDRAMINLLADTGMRSSEIVLLKPEDVDIESAIITLSKGRKLPMSTDTTQRIQEYMIAKLSFKHASKAVLFVNKHGTKLSTRSIRRKLDTHLARAGLDVTINPSTLRHSYAKMLLDNGLDTAFVGKVLGHTSHNTVATYFPPQKKVPVAA